MKKIAITVLLVSQALVSGCAPAGNTYGSLVSNGTNQARGYRFGEQTRDISGPSNRALETAEYRSNIQASTTENYARAQHAELGVVDHKLDTANRAQRYDHQAHMDGNEESKDNFRVFDSISGSIRNTGSNISGTLDSIKNIFHK